jgi:hypothetical protein
MRKTIYMWLPGIVLLGILFCGFSISSIAQTVIKSNTSLVIASGTTVIESMKFKMDNSSTLLNSGKIILKGDLENDNSSGPNNLGTGTFEFSGSTAQTISGQNIMNNVTVNNPAGVVIGGNTEVDGILTLTSGLVTLGSYNLLMGASATVGGTPSASSMVVATGTGQLQKIFTGTGSFTYPVGDAGPHYSPVTLNFSSGTFSSSTYAGVNLAASAYPGMTGDYLNRYWTVTSNITPFTASAQFNYQPGDVTGTEANLYCVRVDPNLATYDAANTGSHFLTASGLTSFGTFTGGRGALQAGLTAFLQGPYDPGTDLMNKDLTTLPLHTGAGSNTSYFPNNQPYSGAPWNYTGTESVTVLPANTVDWVLVELRHGTAASNATSAKILGSRAAFLLNNGSIVDLDGSSLKFRNILPFSDNLYVVIWHRNHMAIMANNTVTRDGNQVYSYNYSTGSAQVSRGISGYVQINTSPVRWGMVAGDANSDNMVLGNDYTDFWVPTFNTVNKYMPADFNLDTFVLGNDYTNFWVPNFNKVNILP